jgi:hypothetical protein
MNDTTPEEINPLHHYTPERRNCLKKVSGTRIFIGRFPFGSI